MSVPRRVGFHVRRGRGSVCLLLGTCLWLSATVAAQRAIAPLRGVAVPQPSGFARYVADPQALVALGKALFWDVQVGSDGRTACATCHFHAGADHRARNQMASPQHAALGLRPNLTLTADDFPFHAFAHPLDNGSAVVRDQRLVVGSAGVVQRTFVDVTDGSSVDESADTGGPGVFSLGRVKRRPGPTRKSSRLSNFPLFAPHPWDRRPSAFFTG